MEVKFAHSSFTPSWTKLLPKQREKFTFSGNTFKNTVSWVKDEKIKHWDIHKRMQVMRVREENRIFMSIHIYISHRNWFWMWAYPVATVKNKWKKNNLEHQKSFVSKHSYMSIHRLNGIINSHSALQVQVKSSRIKRHIISGFNKTHTHPADPQ